MELYYQSLFLLRTCSYAPQLAKIDQRAKVELQGWYLGKKDLKQE